MDTANGFQLCGKSQSFGLVGRSAKTEEQGTGKPPLIQPRTQYTLSLSLSLSRTHTRTHARTHIHARTHTHTHTHTHVRTPIRTQPSALLCTRGVTKGMNSFSRGQRETEMDKGMRNPKNGGSIAEFTNLPPNPPPPHPDHRHVRPPARGPRPPAARWSRWRSSCVRATHCRPLR